MVDVCRTRTAEVADLFLQVVPDQDYEVLGVLRARLKNRTLAVEEVGGLWDQRAGDDVSSGQDTGTDEASPGVSTPH